MSPPATGASPTPAAGPAASRTAPTGVVRLVIGDTNRPSSSEARASRQPGGQPPSSEAPAGEWSFRWSVDGPGPLVAGSEPEPDLVLTLSAEDFELLRRGQLALSVAFMQGRLKTAGDNALLLRVLEWSATGGLERLLSVT
jgi:hypothetical protein